MTSFVGHVPFTTVHKDWLGINLSLPNQAFAGLNVIYVSIDHLSIAEEILTTPGVLYFHVLGHATIEFNGPQFNGLSPFLALFDEDSPTIDVNDLRKVHHRPPSSHIAVKSSSICHDLICS